MHGSEGYDMAHIRYIMRELIRNSIIYKNAYSYSVRHSEIRIGVPGV